MARVPVDSTIGTQRAVEDLNEEIRILKATISKISLSSIEKNVEDLQKEIDALQHLRRIPPRGYRGNTLAGSLFLNDDLFWSVPPSPGTPAVGAPVGLGNANSIGAGPAFPYNDHVHKRDVRAKKTGVDVATRNALDFIDSGSIAISVVDDGANDEVDISVAAITGTPVGLGNANTLGSGPGLSRYDHVHKRDTRVKENGADVGTRNALNFIDGSVSWTIVDDAGGDKVDISASISPSIAAQLKTVELDFGIPAVVGKTFTVVDGDVTPTSKLMMMHSGKAATGKQADEAEFDAIDCRCEPLAGSFRVYATSLLGHVTGPFKFDYAIQT